MTQNTPLNDLPDMDVGDRLEPFDVREHSNTRAAAIAIGAFALLLLLAVIIFKSFANPRADGVLPMVEANTTDPIKVRPEQPGGHVTPNQDKQVYSAVEGQTGQGAVTPGAITEEPLEPPKPAPTRPNIVIKEPAVSIPEPVMPAPKPTAVAPKPVQPKPAPKPAPTPARTTVTPGNSNWVVQVASVRSQEQAGQQWAAMQRKFPSLLSDLYADVRRVDLEDKGIYYRVRIAGVAAKADANSLCRQFKASGQSCFVTQK